MKASDDLAIDIHVFFANFENLWIWFIEPSSEQNKNDSKWYLVHYYLSFQFISANSFIVSCVLYYYYYFILYIYSIIILYEQMNDSLLVLFPWFNRSLEKGEKKKMIGDEQQIEWRQRKNLWNLVTTYPFSLNGILFLFFISLLLQLLLLLLLFFLWQTT